MNQNPFILHRIAEVQIVDPERPMAAPSKARVSLFYRDLDRPLVAVISEDPLNLGPPVHATTTQMAISASLSWNLDPSLILWILHVPERYSRPEEFDLASFDAMKEGGELGLPLFHPTTRWNVERILERPFKRDPSPKELEEDGLEAR